MLICGKLNKIFEIEVSLEELKESFKNRICGYFGGVLSFDMEFMVDSMVDCML